MRKLLWVLVLIVIMGAAFIFTAKPLFNIDIKARIRKRHIHTTSVSVLQETRTLFSLQTVEFVYKIVFPYDFAPADYDWRRLLQKQEQQLPLSQTERDYYDVFIFCKNIGINLLSNRYQFVVLTALVKAGYDLSGTVYEHPETVENLTDYVRIDEDRKTLYLRLPEPKILEFDIEDAASNTYSYPDIDISPAHWKLLTTFAEERVKRRILQRGILELAKKRGEAFIQKLVMDAGFKEIIFLPPAEQTSEEQSKYENTY